MGKIKEITTKKVSSPSYCKGECIIIDSHYVCKGYPKIKINGKMQLVSRMVYKYCWGEIPDGMIIRHKCDNPGCINPSPLEIGSHKDNSDDKIKRGRYRHANSKGTKTPRCKLTEQDIIDIRNDKKSTNKELAAKYGVTHSAISCIRLYKSWKHIR